MTKDKIGGYKQIRCQIYMETEKDIIGYQWKQKDKIAGYSWIRSQIYMDTEQGIIEYKWIVKNKIKFSIFWYLKPYFLGLKKNLIFNNDVKTVYLGPLPLKVFNKIFS